jgi:hypothetical protein
MSTHMLEKLLFDVAATPQRAAEYSSSPDLFLSAYRLDDDEIQLIKQLDVREMMRRSLNPMLLMRAFSALEGRERLPEYLRRMREG